MIGAFYTAFPKDISAEGIAASLLMLIRESAGVASNEDKGRVSRKKIVKHLKHLIQLVAQQLGAAFDACKLLESMMSYEVDDEAWTIDDEEDRSRLMFQCILLLVPANKHPSKGSRKAAALTDTEAEALQKKLSKARKLVLNWFCTRYGPYFNGSNPKGDDEIGAGFPVFRSVLGGLEGNKLYPAWLKIARCLLFMETSESALMNQFVRTGGKAADEKDVALQDEKYRIDRCYEYGGDFDDDMMWIVLKSASQDEGGIDSQIALTLLEHLFEGCNIHRRGCLKLNDIMLAWELYSLVFYEPPETVVRLQQVAAPEGRGDAPGSKFDDAEEDMIEKTKLEAVRVNTEDLELPQ